MARTVPAFYLADMSKPQWLITAALVLLLFTAAKGPYGFALGAAIVGVPYLLSCVFHPRTTHRACKGRGYRRSAWYPWATRRCRGCSGGIQVRHGARAVGLPHVRDEHQKRTRTIKKNRERHSWR